NGMRPGAGNAVERKAGAGRNRDVHGLRRNSGAKGPSFKRIETRGRRKISAKQHHLLIQRIVRDPCVVAPARADSRELAPVRSIPKPGSCLGSVADASKKNDLL